MREDWKPKQLCELPAEVMESARYNADKIYESFYGVMGVSKNDYEKRQLSTTTNIIKHIVS